MENGRYRPRDVALEVAEERSTLTRFFLSGPIQRCVGTLSVSRECHICELVACNSSSICVMDATEALHPRLHCENGHRKVMGKCGLAILNVR